MQDGSGQVCPDRAGHVTPPWTRAVAPAPLRFQTRWRSRPGPRNRLSPRPRLGDSRLAIRFNRAQAPLPCGVSDSAVEPRGGVRYAVHLLRRRCRVVVPGSYAVGKPRRESVPIPPGAPGEPGFEQQVAKDAAVLAALEDSGLELMERVDLSPRTPATSTGGASHPTVRGTVCLDVDVPPGDEDAVVLLERDGVYSWHLPTGSTRPAHELDRPRPADGAFEIDVQPVPTAGRHGGAGDGRRDRPIARGDCSVTSSRAPPRRSSSGSLPQRSSARRSSRWRRTFARARAHHRR